MKTLSLSSVGLALIVGGLTIQMSALSTAMAAEAPHGKLIWSDEFDGTAGTLPDSSKWSIETGGGGYGNHELESYTNRPENVQQRDGNLVITARKEPFTGSDKIQRNYTSARLQTKGHFAQAYGRFEARMQLPSGKGIWPAFWLLGDNVDTAHWPECGEIDVLETIGDPHTIYSTLHGPGYSGKNAISAKFPLPAGVAVDDGFHVYAVEWTPERIRFLFDDQLIVERTPKDLPAGSRWVYDHPFFILLNFAVGGDWPGSPNEQTLFPQKLLVDYVRVYDAKP
ncbi:MAG: glycoside hydrolase family 16 protein [Acidobacteriota bacterium]|nr:glycoside hydrolase family 16 protein [Acidobacteriota bacterium]